MTAADRGTGTATDGTAAVTHRPAEGAAGRPSPRVQLSTLASAMLRGFFRDRTALFFTFFFPLMFLVVFGLVFRDTGSGPTPIGVVGS